ncbi:MAG: RsiV family protein [Thermodesulfobacteriota bacterium]
MKKFLIPFIIVVLFIILLQLYVLNEQNRCLESGGAWIKDICLKKDTPEKELKKLGLIEDEKSKKAEIHVTYTYKVLEYPEIFEDLKIKVEDAKKDNGFDEIDNDFREGSPAWQLNVDMNNFTQAGNLASILGYVFSFTGGAHPNHSFFSVNFNTESQEQFGFSDLFMDQKNALKSISEYSVDDILKQKKEKLVDENTDKDWIMEGAGPNEKNFQIFTIVPHGHLKIKALRFVFPPYSVGPYYEGTYEVEVPSKIFYEQLVEKYKADFIN